MRRLVSLAGHALLAAVFVMSLNACAANASTDVSTDVSTDAPARKSLDREPDVHWEPTMPEVVDAMLRAVGTGPNDIVYDLGCGDGRIVIAAAKEFGARAVGIDIDPERIAEANANARKAGVGNRARFVRDDLFTADFREATVVTLYLLPDLNLKLRPRLLAELKPGTRIVSHKHDMGDWKPDRSVRVGSRILHVWTVPAR